MENQPKHPIKPLPMRGISHYTLGSFSIDLKPSRLIMNDSCISEKIDDSSSIKDNNNSARQDEINFNNEDLKLMDNQHDFESLDKGKQVIRETESNQIEQVSDGDGCLELIKWHLKVISIKDTSVPELEVSFNIY
jgi:hypothetical protein